MGSRSDSPSCAGSLCAAAFGAAAAAAAFAAALVLGRGASHTQLAAFERGAVERKRLLNRILGLCKWQGEWVNTQVQTPTDENAPSNEP